MIKKIFASFIILFFISTIGWLLYEASMVNVIEVGSKFPQVKYIGETGENVLKQKDERSAMILYYDIECPSCEYELDLLETNIAKLQEINIYLLTTKEYKKNKEKVEVFSALCNSSNVIFGSLSEEEFKGKIGIGITPTFLFFNKAGILTKVLSGETKYSLIEDAVNKIR